MKKIILTTLFLLLLTKIYSQTATISGKVVDAKTLAPLPLTNIFLNNTTIGTETNSQGDFILKNVKQPATYEMIISFVGYVSVKLKFDLAENEAHLDSIKLMPSEVELNSVEISTSKDLQWEKKLKKFKKIFLGEDKFAALCNILNPWVIDFTEDESGKNMKAVADVPIEIENKGLGYKLKFYLNNFTADNLGYFIQGNVHFEEITSMDENEKEKWAINRQKTYLHSRQHLFKAIVDQRIAGEGFNLYTEVAGFENTSTRSAFFLSELGNTVKPYDTAAIVKVYGAGLYRIELKGRTEIHYRKEKAPVQTYRDVKYPVSWIRLKENFVIVNKDGVEQNPSDVIVSGDMSHDRVALMLPIDYSPPAKDSEKNQFLFSQLQENIYVQMDKAYYYPGEQVWFKGYMNYSDPALRDSLSKTVYIEIIDPAKKSAILSKILKIDSGFFHGDLKLQDSIKNGNYYLRAYTNLNRIFGDKNLYVKLLPVLNRIDQVDSRDVVTSKKEEGIVVTTDKEFYKIREKIILTLSVKEEDGEPIASDLSISVTDASQVVPIEISNSILRDFPLKEIQPYRGKKDSLYTVEYGLTLNGIFLNDKNKPEKTLINILQLNPKNFAMSESDEDGRFTVSGLTFYDTAQFIIQALGKKNKPYGYAKLMPRKIPAIYINVPEPKIKLVKDFANKRVIANSEFPLGIKMLKEVEFKGTRIATPDKMRTYGHPDYVVNAKDINTSYGNLLLGLQGKVPGLVIRQAYNSGSEPRWVIYLQKASTGSILYPKEVLLMINDVAMGGNPADILSTMDPNTVESVEVKTSVSVLNGSLGGSGVVFVRLKKDFNDPVNPFKAKITRTVKAMGYSWPGEFESPDYTNLKKIETFSDFRSTIYWNPEVETSSHTGTATLSFFAADYPCQYHIVAEGITQNGAPVRGEYYITIVD